MYKYYIYFSMYRLMPAVVVTDVPVSIVKRFGDKMTFGDLLGLNWDGMDWCLYDEVLPGDHDKQSYKEILGRDESEFISLDDL